MQYRSEIDGLRALAVLPVVLFHGGITGFSGGFVGVDIFFVISGYLITSIICHDLEAGKFTFARFYERRARRILPALFAVMAACLPFAWFWLGPHQFDDFADSALAAILFVSNIYFWNQSGYFAPESDTQPLLHTWSLAVEEQFYLLFPILLILLYRSFLRDRTTLVIVLIGLASYVLCQWGWRNAPDANFYLAPFRAWELMAGACCAMAIRKASLTSFPMLGLLGLGMIIASVVLFDEATPFPSTTTLLPVLGSVLVILYATAGTIAARLLSLRPVVAIGLVSYSFYLWHQPVFVFARARWDWAGSSGPTLVLAVISLALAGLSWRFIEQPFRRPSGTRKSGNRQLVLLAGGAAALAGTMALVTVQQGFVERFDPVAIARVTAGREAPALLDECKLDYDDVEAIPCRHGAPDAAQVRIALVGDSHASQWTEVLDLAGRERGWQVETYAKSACPMANIRFSYFRLRREYTECETWRGNVRQALASGDFDLVLVTQSSMSYVFQQAPFAVERAEWNRGMEGLVADLDRLDTRWILLSDNPRFAQGDPVECLFRTDILGFAPSGSCDANIADALDEEGRDLEQQLTTSSEHGSWVDLAGQLCDSEACSPARDEILMMSDQNHLSREGALSLGPLLVDEIEIALAGQTQIALDTRATDEEG